MSYKIQKEIWKDIKGYESLYQVSNYGNIKRLRRMIKCKYKYKLIEESMLKPFFNNGYLRIALSKNNKRKKYLIHRLVAESFIPNKENKKEVNHKDGDKSNNNVINLEWCTGSENVKHAFDKGLRHNHKGENHPSHKLTEKIVLEIRENKHNLKGIELARKYKVRDTTIYNILKKRRWSHI